MKYYFLSIFIAAFFQACSTSSSEEEVLRIYSPSGKIMAILKETNGGATSSFGYEVSLLEQGKFPPSPVPIAFLYGAVRNESAYGVNLRWQDENQLFIEYLSARSKTIYRDSVKFGDSSVFVSIHEGVEDLTAPAGGMLYNLKKDLPKKIYL